MIFTRFVVDLLNDLHRIDPEAADAILSIRVPCNEEIASHPTITVGDMDSEGYGVGVLGVVNGILGSAHEPLVCSVHDRDTGEMKGFDVYPGNGHGRAQAKVPDHLTLRGE